VAAVTLGSLFSEPGREATHRVLIGHSIQQRRVFLAELVLQCDLAAQSPSLSLGRRTLGLRQPLGNLLGLGLLGFLDLGQPLCSLSVLLGPLRPFASLSLPVHVGPCVLDSGLLIGLRRLRGAIVYIGHSALPCGTARSPCGSRALTSTRRTAGSLIS